jgi:hypothetical protein
MAFRKMPMDNSEVCSYLSLICLVHHTSPHQAYLNNHPLNARVMHKISTFVEQEDALLGVLTVRESVTYALRLQLSVVHLECSVYISLAYCSNQSSSPTSERRQCSCRPGVDSARPSALCGSKDRNSNFQRDFRRSVQRFIIEELCLMIRAIGQKRRVTAACAMVTYP